MSDTAPLSTTAAAVTGNAQAVEGKSTAVVQAGRDGASKKGLLDSSSTAALNFSDIFQTLQLPSAILPSAEVQTLGFDQALAETLAVADFGDVAGGQDENGNALPLPSIMGQPSVAALETVQPRNHLAGVNIASVAFNNSDSFTSSKGLSQSLEQLAPSLTLTSSNTPAITLATQATAQLRPNETGATAGFATGMNSETDAEIKQALLGLDPSLNKQRADQTQGLAQTKETIAAVASTGQAIKAPDETLLARISQSMSSPKPSSSTETLSQGVATELSKSLAQFTTGVSVSTQRVAAQIQGSAMNFQRLSSAQFNQQNAVAMQGEALLTSNAKAADAPAQSPLLNASVSNGGIIQANEGGSTALSKSMLLSSLHSQRTFGSSRVKSGEADASTVTNSNLGRINEGVNAFGLQQAVNGLSAKQGSAANSQAVQASLNNTQWFSSLADKASSQLALSSGNVQLQLEPEALGKLDIQIAAGQALSIKSTNPEVQTFLNDQLVELEQAFDKVRLSSDSGFTSSENHRHDQGEGVSNFDAAFNDADNQPLRQNTRERADILSAVLNEKVAATSERVISLNEGSRLSLFA